MDILIDPKLVTERRKRAAGQFEPKAGFLLDIAAEEFSLRLSTVERHFERGVELFGGTGSAAHAAMSTGKVGVMERIDVVAESRADRLTASLEDVPLAAEAYNLVLAPLFLHLVNDLPGSLIRMRRALKPDGLLLAAIPGAGTLAELNDVLIETEQRFYGGASPRVVPFGEVRAIGGLLQRAGFSLPVADVENYTVRYDSLFGLMADLRALGQANPLTDRSRRPVSRAFFLEAAKLYGQRYSDPDGRIRATFSIIFLAGWAPHESQQKPLKPGSAKVRLEDALKAVKPPQAP